MRKLRRVAASAAATFLLAIGGVAASVTVASAGTIGSCNSSGGFAVCVASGTATKPLTITVTVTASPNQEVDVYWSTVCSLGDSAASSSGEFDATTPVTRTISHPFKQPDSCDVAADGGLANGSGSIKVSIASSSTPLPPKVTAVKGYDGKCADDTGDSSAKGAKVELWSCTKGAAQNWSFSGGYLKHSSECANDESDGGNGSKVILYTCTTAQNDRWTHESNGEYVLAAHSGKLCLTDPGKLKVERRPAHRRHLQEHREPALVPALATHHPALPSDAASATHRYLRTLWP